MNGFIDEQWLPSKISTRRMMSSAMAIDCHNIQIDGVHELTCSISAEGMMIALMIVDSDIQMT